MKDRKFPPGWDAERVERLLARYSDVSEDEQVTEDSNTVRKTKRGGRRTDWRVSRPTVTQRVIGAVALCILVSCGLAGYIYNEKLSDKNGTADWQAGLAEAIELQNSNDPVRIVQAWKEDFAKDDYRTLANGSLRTSRNGFEYVWDFGADNVYLTVRPIPEAKIARDLEWLILTDLGGEFAINCVWVPTLDRQAAARAVDELKTKSVFTALRMTNDSRKREMLQSKNKALAQAVAFDILTANRGNSIEVESNGKLFHIYAAFDPQKVEARLVLEGKQF